MEPVGWPCVDSFGHPYGSHRRGSAPTGPPFSHPPGARNRDDARARTELAGPGLSDLDLRPDRRPARSSSPSPACSSASSCRATRCCSPRACWSPPARWTFPLWLVCVLIVRRRDPRRPGRLLFGSKVGPSLFKRPDSRLFKQENVEKAHEFFEKYGPKSLVLARFVPIVRTFTPIIAGVSRMNYRSFLTYNVIGGIALGRGRHAARRLARQDRVRQQEHRGDAGPDRAASRWSRS